MDKTKSLIALSLRSIADALVNLDKEICIRDLDVAAGLLREAQAEADRYHAKKITNQMKGKSKCNSRQKKKR